MSIETKLEAILFFRGEATSFDELARILQVTLDEAREGTARLKESLAGRGIRVLITDDSAALVTAQEVSEFIETLRKEEYAGEITKAAAETLAIVLYQGPLQRFEIDYLRGVNSTFTIRNLLIRGLIEKVPNPNDKRGFLYKASADLLAHLGLTEVTELPEFDKVKRELEAFKASQVESAADTLPPHEEN
jgi:segregation and condensation protein B